MSTSTVDRSHVDYHRRRFEDAFHTAFAAFHKRKKLKAYRDLSPRFWVAWLDLQEFAKAYKQFGAPGDFGYGTPPGEGLKKLYFTWNDLMKAAAAAAGTQPS